MDQVVADQQTEREAAEVAAGAEGVAGSSDDDRARRIVGTGPDEDFGPPIR